MSASRNTLRRCRARNDCTHLIDREYNDVIDNTLFTAEKVMLLAREFRNRLTSLVANWIRIGYCQGNFNSDNFAARDFTLDYGPFGFCDLFNPRYRPWTGGEHHFSFLNQPMAAQRNFHMFCTALQPLVASHQNYTKNLDEIRSGFTIVTQANMEKMWAEKLGLHTFITGLFRELETLMAQTAVDYTIFFRGLSTLPDDIGPLKKSIYKNTMYNTDPEGMVKRWSEWLTTWKSLNTSTTAANTAQHRFQDGLSRQMKHVNPKYNVREWFVVPAYQQASIGNHSLVRELQEVMTQPYAEQSIDVEEKYYRLKPLEFFETVGLSHYSCSS
ncbi:MAG: hypothetical protein ACI9LX_003191 [Paraglaciecola sp.]